MSQSSNTLFDRWINGKFESKMVISVTQKEQYKNLGVSLINGRPYSTKLGAAMSIQLGPNDLQELIEVLQEIQNKFLPPFTPKKEDKGP